jgi:hypothetical protein
MFFITCKESPEGIQNALFDETGGNQPELDLSFTFRNDVNNQLSVIQNQNGIPNWSERIYFDTIITNRLENSVSDVQLQIVGVDNSSFITDWNTDVLNFGFISTFDSAVPDRYWCFFCNEPNEQYLGRTWVTASLFGSGTASATINMRITFSYDGSFVSQDVSHTFTIFP